MAGEGPPLLYMNWAKLTMFERKHLT